MQVLVGLQNGVDVQQALAPQAVTAPVAGPALNVGNDLGPVSVTLNVGAVTGTNPSLTAQLEEYNGTSWNIVPGTSAVTVTTADQVVAITGKNNYNQVRLNVTGVTGTTPSFTVGAELLSQQRVGSVNPAGYSNYPATAT